MSLKDEIDKSKKKMSIHRKFKSLKEYKRYATRSIKTQIEMGFMNGDLVVPPGINVQKVLDWLIKNGLDATIAYDNDYIIDFDLFDFDV